MSESSDILNSAKIQYDRLKAERVAAEAADLAKAEAERAEAERIAPLIELSKQRGLEFAQLMIKYEQRATKFFTRRDHVPILFVEGWEIKPSLHSTSHGDDKTSVGMSVASDGSIFEYRNFLVDYVLHYQNNKPERVDENQWPNEGDRVVHLDPSSSQFPLADDIGLSLLGEYVAKSGILGRINSNTSE